MRVRDRLFLCAKAAGLVAAVIAHGLAALDTDALTAAPALVLLVLLAAGRYVGSERLVRIAERVPRPRWRAPARAVLRRRPALRPSPRGGLLIAVSLARRGPPPARPAAPGARAPPLADCGRLARRSVVPADRTRPRSPDIALRRTFTMPAAAQPTREQRRDAARRARVEREAAVAAAAARRRRLILLGGVLGVAAIAVAVLIAVSTSGSGAKTAATSASSGSVADARESSAMLAGIPQNSIVLGNAKAPVRVIEFADLQCPFCRNYALNTMPSLVKDYVRPGKVRMEFRSLAFIGDDSVRAARVAEAAAQQNKLWNFVDLAYFNQGKENSGWANDAALKRLAGAVPGLDANRAFAARDSAGVTASLKAADTLATSSGVQSTPTFLVGRGANLKAVDAAGLPAAIKAAIGS